MIETQQKITFTDRELIVLKEALVRSFKGCPFDDNKALISLMDKADIAVSRLSIKQKVASRS